MKFRPLHDRVVVQRIDAEEKTAGGIIIPDTAKEKPSQGEVIAVGPGGRDEAGKLIPHRRQGRRPRAVRQMVGHRGQDRRPGSPDHEGVRHHGRHRGAVRQEEGRLTPDHPEEPRERVSRMGRVTAHPSRRELAAPQDEDQQRSESNGCQGSQILGRRARQDAARRRHSRQRGEGDARPEGPQRRARQVVRRAAHHQGRRHRRQGDRARGQVREHGRADGARGRLEDLRHRRRRHHHRDRARRTRSSAKAPRRSPPA